MKELTPQDTTVLVGFTHTQKAVNEMSARTGHRTYRTKRARTLAGKNLTCAWCGTPIDKTLPYNHPMAATADHITPVSKGGSNFGKLQPMHRSCNSKKGNRTPPAEVKHARDW